MKMQFTVLSILLATTFVAISCVGIGFAAKILSAGMAPSWTWFFGLLSDSPCWVPIVFAAYAIGRQKLSWKILAFFAVVEAGAMALVFWMFTHL